MLQMSEQAHQVMPAKQRPPLTGRRATRHGRQQALQRGKYRLHRCIVVTARRRRGRIPAAPASACGLIGSTTIGLRPELRQHA
ncbi:hypothetical protein D3C81_1748620 [compost metagenome]